MKKPFKETKLGKFLTEKVPAALEVVGDVLPDKGVLGVIKNIVDRSPDIPETDRLEFERLLRDHEVEMETLYQQDRASARTRETEYVKSLGHADWMMYFVGVIVMCSFIVLQYVLIQVTIPEANRDMFIHMMGMIDTAAGLVIGYYFGSSRGSQEKNRMFKP